ncbi:hypothetical protein ACI2VF_02160 [Ralstonia nicotianae]
MRYVTPWLFALLTGCSSTQVLHSTFEDLGAETSMRVGTDGIRYRTAINVTGLGQPVIAGGQMNVPGSGLPEQLASGVSTGCSYLVDQRFNTDAAEEIVSRIEVAIGALTAAYSEAAVNQTAELLLANLDSKPAPSGAQEAAVRARVARLLDKPENSDVATLTAALKAKRDKDIQAVKDAEVSINKVLPAKNVLIDRWSASKDSSWSSGLGTLIGGNGESSSKRSGYMILADIRVTSLVPGDDFAIWAQRTSEQKKSGSDGIFTDTFLNTYNLSAKVVRFKEDMDLSSLIATKLSITGDQLKELLGSGGQALLLSQNLELQAAIAKALQIGSQGMFSLSAASVYHYRFWGDRARAAANKAELTRSLPYRVVYTVRNSVGDLNKPITYDGGRQCMHAVVADAVNQAQGTYDQAQDGDKFCWPAYISSTGNSYGHDSPDLWLAQANRCVSFGIPIITWPTQQQ